MLAHWHRRLICSSIICMGLDLLQWSPNWTESIPRTYSIYFVQPWRYLRNENEVFIRC
ncbi:hypothetical protein PR001_g2259 [Phytophthora rubi]|uniref:Uncharacterized protein n=1 Tax=Phytophthora rubi TaxID=129364 RepID=A0A6A3PD78_9STRA|nr:hypothetical protein PR002_g2362 [Phytophthora rubi]KAE9050598.1 hypothetical protein PR001_g2259 [Phytophthora rubi]